MKKIHELRNKSIKELNDQLTLLLREKFNLNLQLVNHKLNKTHLSKNIRRDIAIIKTLLTEKKTRKINDE